MQITVHFLGQARQLAECSQISLDAEENASVDDLLPAILEGRPERLAVILADENKLRRSVMPILRDETVSPSTKGLLHDGDELSLLPPMSGG